MLETVISIIPTYYPIYLLVIIVTLFLISLFFLLNKTTPIYVADTISSFRILKIPKKFFFPLPPFDFKKITVDNNDPDYLDKEELNNDLNKYGFAYDEEQDMFYSTLDAWQRNHGYCKSYDLVSPFINLIFESEPIYFNYDNRRWLIEFWKGQYGMTTGGEVGVYVSDKEKDKTKNPDLIIYDSVSNDELLPMAFTLKKNDNVLLTRSKAHWWVTGFKLGEFSEPKNLVMDITIKLKDEAMRDAFIEGLKKIGYKDNEIAVYNNSVSLTFDRPRTPQPFTNVGPLIAYAQAANKRNCNIYNKLTKRYTHTLDKLTYIKLRYPTLYSKMLNISNRI